MWKIRFAWAAVLLCGLLAGCAVRQGASAREAASEVSASNPAQDEAQAFAKYGSYGLSFDEETRQLTYNGQRVRYFEDWYPVHWNTPEDGMAGMTFFDEAGVVDVHANRNLSVRKENEDGNYDPSGTLTGLSPFTQQEFNARDVRPLNTPTTQATTAGEPMTAAQLKALYAPYAAYGITYNADKDLLFFDGRQVRRFTDILSTNGEDPAGGNFQGSMMSRWDEGGTVDIRAVRDHAKPDADGYGLLTGVEAATEAEFDAATKQAEKDGPQVSFYFTGETVAQAAQEG